MKRIATWYPELNVEISGMISRTNQKRFHNFQETHKDSPQLTLHVQLVK